MAGNGGKRVGAGRKVGVPNKTNKKVREAAAASGILPLEYMLDIMRNPKVPKSRRDWAAQTAAPYLHSKMTAVTHSSDPKKPMVMVHRTMSLQEAAQAYQDMLKS